MRVEDRRDEGFVVLGISTDQTGGGIIRELLEARTVICPVAMANREVVESFGGVGGLPTSLLIAREGGVPTLR